MFLGDGAPEGGGDGGQLEGGFGFGVESVLDDAQVTAFFLELPDGEGQVVEGIFASGWGEGYICWLMGRVDSCNCCGVAALLLFWRTSFHLCRGGSTTRAGRGR